MRTKPGIKSQKSGVRIRSGRELLAVGIFGRGSLGDGIETLLQRGRVFSPRASVARVALSGLALLGFVIAGALAPRWIAFAQPPLAFEVASVKPNTSPTDRGVLRFEAARFIAKRRSLRNFIMQAYGIQNYQIAGLPDSLERERYDVEAKSAQPAVEEQLTLMLQTLLAERFKLQFHRETKEMPVFVLSVGKNGPKIARADDTETPEIKVVPRQVGDRTAYQLIRRKMPIGHLAGMLTAQLGRPVLDHTGLKGNFDFTTEIGPDDNRPAQASDGEPVNEKATLLSLAPSSVIAAMQADLGLKLESTKAPVEIVVIDHAEKPDAN
jgi:uncharacterized protein (TIGR03435 family)